MMLIIVLVTYADCNSLLDIVNKLPWADVCEAPQTEDELYCVKETLEEEEPPQLHHGGVEDVHQEASDVRHPLGGDRDVDGGDALEGVRPWLSLAQRKIFYKRRIFVSTLWKPQFLLPRDP